MVTGGGLRNQSFSDQIQETLRVWKKLVLQIAGDCAGKSRSPG
jgi:hypothetical protein